MKKAGLMVRAGLSVAVVAIALAGCGGSGDSSSGSSGASGATGNMGSYTVLERNEGPGQITYHVRASASTTQAEADAILKELEAKGGGKATMVNIYDGERDAKNMVFSCSGGSCVHFRK